MKKLNWAVVGFGHIGRRHAANIIENDLCKLVAICDCKDKAELIFDEKTENLPFFKGIDSLLSSNIDLDVVSVCVPNGLHFDISYQTLQKGIFTVIEKPIVLKKEDGEKLLSVSDNGRLVYGVLQNRYTKVMQWLKNIVSSGILGRIYHLNMSCLWNRDERYYKKNDWHGDALLDGGTLFTQYSHFVDILLWVFGDMQIKNASFANLSHKGMIDFEDTGDIDFSTDIVECGRLFYSTSVYGKNMNISMDILAENGSIRISGPFLNILEHCCIKGMETPDLVALEKTNDYGLYSGSASNHNYVIDNIAKHILSQPSEVTTLQDGLRVVNTINEIYKFKNL